MIPGIFNILLAENQKGLYTHICYANLFAKQRYSKSLRAVIWNRPTDIFHEITRKHLFFA